MTSKFCIFYGPKKKVLILEAIRHMLIKYFVILTFLFKIGAILVLFFDTLVILIYWQFSQLRGLIQFTVKWRDYTHRIYSN